MAGVKDSIITSCDKFVEKGKESGMNITYFRIEDMDHYIRYRPDVINKCFVWLKNQIELNPIT